MTAFYILATLMVLVAIAFVLWPLVRPSTGGRVERQAANLSIFRDQFADLEADLGRGTLSPDQHAEAKAELERRLLDEGRPETPTAAITTRPRVTAAVALALILPLAAGLLYWRWGEPDAISMAAVKAHAGQETPEEMVQMVEQLAQRLKTQPDNAEGWFVLARSYYTLRRFPEAAAAFEKVAALVPNDASVLADYADALAMSRNRDLSGPPMELVERALQIDPTQWKALAMAGTAAFERKDYAQAVSYWERLKASQPPDSPLAKSIQSSISEARQLGQLGPAAIAAQPPAAAKPAPAAEKPATAVAGKTVSGTVVLSPALAAKAAPTDTVFVFARPNDGSKMPLALVRAQVKDLPLKFTLDDSRAMSPAATISMHELVIVAARVARSGSAAAQSGDLQGLTSAVKVGSRDLVVTIDQVIP